MRKALRRLRAADRRADGLEEGDVNGEMSTSGIARSSGVEVGWTLLMEEGMVVDCEVLNKLTECLLEQAGCF